MKASLFSAAVDKLNGLVFKNIPTINEKMALDATAQIKDRIVNSGTKADGSPLGEYSRAEIPLFFKKNGKVVAPFTNPLNGDGEGFYLKVRKENEGKKKKNGGDGSPPRGISYAEWRQANNRPIDHVTLSFSGTTMKDIGVTKQIVSGAKIVTNVGPKNTKIREGGATTDKVVEGLSNRYGNFLAPSKDEIEHMKNYLQKQIEKIIHDSFT